MDGDVDRRELGRQLRKTHPALDIDALRLIDRGFRAVTDEATYFLAETYDRSVRGQVMAHRSFGSFLDSMRQTGAIAEIADLLITRVVREEAARRDTPPILALWLNRSTEQNLALPCFLPLSGIGRIFGGIYAALCRQLGPAEADRMLSHQLAIVRSSVPGFEPTAYL